MKKFKNYFLFIITFFCFICNVQATNNPYPKYEQSVFGGQIINCTWYAWQQAKDNMGVELPLWTYVQTWYSKAEKAGYSVGKDPKPNSIMVWDYGEGFGGHVAYVTSVNGTTVSYKEGGSPMTADGINTDSMTLEMMSSFLVGFIYLDKVPTPPVAPNPAPSTPPSNTQTKPKEESTPKVEEPTKSSNNYLSELTISGLEFEFKKEILEYSFDVAYEVESVTINAKAEDNSATITGNETHKLAVGDNTFNIIVTAEDKTVKEYHIKIKRNEEEKKIEETKPVEEKELEKNTNDNTKKEAKKNTKIKPIIIGSISFIIIIGIILCIYFKSKNNI